MFACSFACLLACFILCLSGISFFLFSPLFPFFVYGSVCCILIVLHSFFKGKKGNKRKRKEKKKERQTGKETKKKKKQQQQQTKQTPKIKQNKSAGRVVPVSPQNGARALSKVTTSSAPSPSSLSRVSLQTVPLLNLVKHIIGPGLGG